MLNRAEQLAATLPPLLVASERIAATVAQGVHGRRRVGLGETFWQFRRYQPGDSVRMIDWRQSAKTQTVFVRETEWEAAQSVWLWRDASASMRYRSRKDLPEKSEHADMLTIALASLLIAAGENVALLGTGHLPISGRAAYHRFCHAVMAEMTTTEGLPGVELLPRHGHVVWIGDLLAPLDEIKMRVAADVARGVHGHLVQVLDPAEETLPFKGRIRFEGLEGEASTLIGRTDTVRAEYAERMTAHQAGLKDLARVFGWSYAVHRTDRPAQTALLALYMALARVAGN
jgi:uncharacterized protein (DUF58 family)